MSRRARRRSPHAARAASPEKTGEAWIFSCDPAPREESPLRLPLFARPAARRGSLGRLGCAPGCTLSAPPLAPGTRGGEREEYAGAAVQRVLHPADDEVESPVASPPADLTSRKLHDIAPSRRCLEPLHPPCQARGLPGARASPAPPASSKCVARKPRASRPPMPRVEAPAALPRSSPWPWGERPLQVLVGADAPRRRSAHPRRGAPPRRRENPAGARRPRQRRRAAPGEPRTLRATRSIAKTRPLADLEGRGSLLVQPRGNVLATPARLRGSPSGWRTGRPAPPR